MILEEILLYFSLKYQGDFMKIYHAIEQKEKVDEKEKKIYLSHLHSSYITILSKEYPDSLKNIACPPFVLYYHGDISLLQQPSVAVVGMRQPNAYGQEATCWIVDEIVRAKHVVVSGMALGIDSIAHQEALLKQGRTIAVLGSGINVCYPAQHQDLYDTLKKEQLIISEYPENTPPRKFYFPQRNRLISGLCGKLVVVQAHLKSGTMITVNHALEQGKSVYCIPGRVNDPIGCNTLISQGAKMIIEAKELWEDESW